MIPGTVHIPRGFLELRIERNVPDRATPVVHLLRERHALGARGAQPRRARLHQRHARSPAASPAGSAPGCRGSSRSSLRPDQESALLAAHACCPRSASPGSSSCSRPRSLCIGAGGLGSPSSMYLAAAGIGTIGMIDDDVVDASNLQRQILHGTDRVGVAKVDSAETTLRGAQPRRQGRQAPDADHVGQRAGADRAATTSIVDGADNFATRYLVNDAALRLGKPVIHASIFRFEGQITVFPANGSPCYRCLFPQAAARRGGAVVRRGRRARRPARHHGRPAGDRGDQAGARARRDAGRPARWSTTRSRPGSASSSCAAIRRARPAATASIAAKIPLIDYEQFCAGPKH